MSGIKFNVDYLVEIINSKIMLINDLYFLSTRLLIGQRSASVVSIGEVHQWRQEGEIYK
jgi:hypothetical protein